MELNDTTALETESQASLSPDQTTETAADPIAAMYPEDAPKDLESTENADPENQDGDDIDGDAAPVEAVAMPLSWSKDDQAIWDAMSPEQQAIVGRRESERDAKLKDLSNETAKVKTTAVAEAHTALAENYEHSAQVLQNVVARFMPQRPDPALLSGTEADRLEHYAQNERYKAALDEVQEIVSQSKELQQKADEARYASLRASAQVSWQNIVRENPDWFDSSANDLTADARQLIETTGAELGYPINLKEEFGADAIGYAELDESDIFAIKRAAEWREKAQKWDAHQQSKAEGHRVAKKLPKTVAQTNVSAPKGPDDWLKAMYPND
jgi:hypothetical protein